MGKLKIGFFPGVFDFVHAGHVIAFGECKQYCDYLIIGLQTNPRGKIPIMSLLERYTMLKANKYVDAIIPYGTEEELQIIESWLPIDFRFRGKDHKGELHYPTRGKFIDIVGDNSIHSSDIRKRCQQSS